MPGPTLPMLSASHESPHRDTSFHRVTSRNLLTPEDAFTARSPPRSRLDGSPIPNVGGAGGVGISNSALRRREQRRNRSRSSRRRKGVWKKLLWVKQSYPDNYTDENTFLDHLQLNPRLQPYELWPLVADSTVIVQQVCTMVLFVCSFSAILQKRVKPITVVSWGSVATVLGWVLWDAWVGQEQAASGTAEEIDELHQESRPTPASSPKDVQGPGVVVSPSTSASTSPSPRRGQGSPIPGVIIPPAKTAASAPATPIAAQTAALAAHPTGAHHFSSYSYYPPYGGTASRFSPRNQQRLATLKSAVLIYCALLGLSPILKSLTQSTAEDSIWAISFWLMCINLFFFDYGGGVGPTFPASLSTNAALMASTVLASRLDYVTDVFSLTLFSIEVFGLFPVFRRYLRHKSWTGHIVLTILLVMGASGSVATIISISGPWKAAITGAIFGGFLTALAMVICSWWLIGLQRYKNEIHGPWDPARPIIRRRWD